MIKLEFFHIESPVTTNPSISSTLHPTIISSGMVQYFFKNFQF